MKIPPFNPADKDVANSLRYILHNAPCTESHRGRGTDLKKGKMEANDSKCCVCGKQAVAYYPCVDPDQYGVVLGYRAVLSILDEMEKEPLAHSMTKTGDIDFEQELYNAFGQVKDFTLGMRIAKRFYDMGKNSQEPVSDDLLVAANKAWQESEDKESYAETFVDGFVACFNWQKKKDSTPSKDLEELINTLSKRYPEVSFAKLSRIAVRVAKWQEDKDKQTLNEEGFVVLPEEEFERMKRSLIKLAEREQQMMAKAIDAVVSQVPCSNEIILRNPASVHWSYLPQEMNELGLNKGDKVKLIIVKEGNL